MALKAVLFLSLIAIGCCLPSRPLVNLVSGGSTLSDAVHCPGSGDLCPANNTCCRVTSDLWGCCDHLDAVCCSDRRHCCPKGQACSADSLKCSDSNTEQPSLILKKISKRRDVLPKIVSRVAINVNCTPPGSKYQWQCPSGSTCCLKPSNPQSYGCCPMIPATCCPGGSGCCPGGYVCNLEENTCTKASSMMIEQYKLDTVAITTGVNGNICPDGRSECLNSDTCCQLATGGFGCCHLTDAVCCADRKHCCPSGYACTDSGCVRSDVPMLEKTPAILKSFSNVSVINCGNNQVCPDGDTCCPTKTTGSFGCCPQPSATCCSDKLHCCPNGYSCTGDGTCVRMLDKYDEVKNLSPLVSKSSKTGVGEKCVGSTVTCPVNNTCCKMSSGDYGCCPQVDAVCCADGVHCCPRGQYCKAHSNNCPFPPCPIQTWCSNDSSFLEPSKKVLAVASDTVTCPDGGSCPENNTCCKKTDGTSYGCCPQQNADCCSDGKHCCPQGYNCNSGDNTCVRAAFKIPALRKLPSLQTTGVKNINCPDGTSSCPDSSTCCKLTTGQYGCCPKPSATCCKDGIHCCPSGYQCDNDNTCKKEASVIPMLKKLPASKPNDVRNIVCPDGRNECPDQSTCCRTRSGYGCCSQENAVCCSDGVHCCPNGFTCDATDNKCTKEATVIPMLKKIPTTQADKGVVCDDKKSECPNGNTCCKTSGNKYSCCPLEYANCCSDNTHCCPTGFKCNEGDGTCVKNTIALSILSKPPAFRLKGVKENVCPDGRSECADDATCCKRDSGNYGCCSLYLATCCYDGKHCCPNGYICNSDGTCNKANSVIKTKQYSLIDSTKEVICGDGSSKCPDGETCCRIKSGGYGCCKLPNAACCGDGVHCCPSGYSCNLADGTCSKKASVVPMLRNRPPASTGVKSITCPDDTACYDNNTCCLTKSNTYGCCPSPNATCCADYTCCPHGTWCDTEGHKCRVSGIKHQPLLTMPPEKPVKKVGNTVCPHLPDQEDKECPDNETCCLVGDKYGCCPFQNAVCCDDKKHCCPNDYYCNKEDGTCTDRSASNPSRIPPVRMRYDKRLL